jgi:plastocyanin
MRMPKPVRVAGDVFCVTNRADNPLIPERYVFNMEKKTLCNVIVYVSGGLGEDFSVPTDAVEIKQHGCQYVPHVVTIMKGQTFKITNDDDTSHNLNLQAENNPPFNEGQPVKGIVKETKFEKPELAMPLKCDVHSWMSAWVAVFDHPYHAVSDENGEFEIKGLPAGEYELTVWHEFDKFTPVEETMKVVVKDGETSTADFTYQPPG